MIDLIYHPETLGALVGAALGAAGRAAWIVPWDFELKCAVRMVLVAVFCTGLIVGFGGGAMIGWIAGIVVGVMAHSIYHEIRYRGPEKS